MTQPRARHQVSFGVSHIAAWAPGVTTAAEWLEWAHGQREIAPLGEPALQQMPPLLRRHAGRLGRLACSVAYDTLAEAVPGNPHDVPVVFSSRYGEVSRSVELLTALAAGSELSPAAFGLSVHNAIPGLFSMARKDTANSVSLAAGDEQAELGVLEACSLLADGASQVLLVVADVPLPAVYAEFADTRPEAFAWACLLRPATTNAVHLEWSETDLPNAQPYSGSALPAPGALAVLPLLLGARREVRRTHAPRSWLWYRQS